MRESLLVIHQGALGDVVLSFPALVALKQKRRASLALLGHNRIGQLAQGLGIVDYHFRAESARFCGLFTRDLSPEMREFTSQFDGIVIVSFSDDMENRIRPHHPGQVLTISPRPPVEEETHVAMHVTKQLEAKGLLRNDQRTNRDLSCLVDSTQSLEKIGKSFGDPSSRQSKSVAVNSVVGYEHGKGVHEESEEKGLFVIHPGAGSNRKRWGLDNFVALAEAIVKNHSGDVVFLIGPDEKDLLAGLTEVAFRKRTYVHQVDDLTKVADLIRGSRCFVGNDSGLSHLAGFLGIPTIAVFGPSSINRWSPLGRAIKVLRGASDCLPCFELEKDNCEDPRCLKGVSVEMAVKALGKLGVI
jgi:ADP-heptose:LPS heptosyltransferase